MLGLDLVLACPEGYAPIRMLVTRARRAGRLGARLDRR